eukprot:TRINITY_DN7182_c0_g1_i2.p1 TRINITY_DN7182_c0_g1~~TRINITY_DN7182_c0_g1_i2.p1  ORF type:complete len:810 (+),score=191.53 TRINITY_DN7182_c0_g1_i2:141-2432(+)
MSASPLSGSLAPSPAASPRAPQSTGVLAAAQQPGKAPSGWDAFRVAITGDAFEPGSFGDLLSAGVDTPGLGPPAGLIPVPELLSVRLDRKEEKGSGKELRPRDRDAFAGMWSSALLAEEAAAKRAAVPLPLPSDSAGDAAFAPPHPGLLEGLPPPGDPDARAPLWPMRCARCSMVSALPPAALPCSGCRVLCWSCGQACDPPEELSSAGIAQGAPCWESPPRAALPPVQGAPDDAAPLDAAGWRLRLARYCAVRAPECLAGAQLEQLLRRWAGSEHDLWQELLQRHGSEPSTAEADAALRSRLALLQLPPPGGGADAAGAYPGAPRTATFSVDLPTSGTPLGCDLTSDPDFTDGREGVLVLAVEPGSSAAKAGLAVRQLIRAVDARRVRSIPEIRAAVIQAREQGNRSVEFTVELPAARKPQQKRRGSSVVGQSNTSLAGAPSGAQPPTPAGRELRCGGCGAVNRAANTDPRFVCSQCGQACDTAALAEAQDGIPVAPRAACRPCPTTGQALDFTEWRQRVARFYAVYAPDRVPGRQLDQILRSWAGREDELLSGMVKRYGPEPSEAEGDEALQLLLAHAVPPDEAQSAGGAPRAQASHREDQPTAGADAGANKGLRSRLMTIIAEKKLPIPARPNLDAHADPAEQPAEGRLGKVKDTPRVPPGGSSPRKPQQQQSDPQSSPLSPLSSDGEATGELRVDSSDGRPYPLSSFIECYGGSRAAPPEQWKQSRRYQPGDLGADSADSEEEESGVLVSLSNEGEIVM